MSTKPYRIDLPESFSLELDELALEAFPKTGGEGNKKKTIEALAMHGIRTMTPEVLRDVYFDYQKEL